MPTRQKGIAIPDEIVEGAVLDRLLVLYDDLCESGAPETEVWQKLIPEIVTLFYPEFSDLVKVKEGLDGRTSRLHSARLELRRLNVPPGVWYRATRDVMESEKEL